MILARMAGSEVERRVLSALDLRPIITRVMKSGNDRAEQEQEETRSKLLRNKARVCPTYSDSNLPANLAD